MTFISIPWDLKILYGLIADTTKLPFAQKTPRRAYLMLFSIIQASLLLLVALIKFDLNTMQYLFFAIAICGAFNDALIDGITCVMQRKDPENGANDL